MSTAALLQKPAQPAPELALAGAVSLETVPACFGVTCPVHAHCARYAAVNRSQADAGTMATCQRGPIFPLFVKIDREEVAQA
jgi:hypothetical protein